MTDFSRSTKEMAMKLLPLTLLTAFPKKKLKFICPPTQKSIEKISDFSPWRLWFNCWCHWRYFKTKQFNAPNLHIQPETSWQRWIDT